MGSLGGDEVRREESSWVEAMPRELSDSLSTSWLRGEDGHLWTVTKSLPDTETGALLLDLQTSDLWKLQTCHLSHLDYDIFATLVIARLQKCLSRKDCQVKENEIDVMYWTDRVMERSWICADLGLKTLFCYYKPWHKLKKNWCFFGQKHPSGFGSRVSVILGSIPKLQWMPLIRAHMVALAELGCLSKQNKTTDPAPKNNLQNEKDMKLKMGGRHD